MALDPPPPPTHRLNKAHVQADPTNGHGVRFFVWLPGEQRWSGPLRRTAALDLLAGDLGVSPPRAAVRVNRARDRMLDFVAFLYVTHGTEAVSERWGLGRANTYELLALAGRRGHIDRAHDRQRSERPA